MDKYEVIFYETEDGTRPAYDFIETLSPKMQAKIYKIASMLEIDGTRLRLPYSEFFERRHFPTGKTAGGTVRGELIWIMQNCWSRIPIPWIAGRRPGS